MLCTSRPQSAVRRLSSVPCPLQEGRTDGRVVRGGSYNNNDRNVRCAYRNYNNPNNRNNNIGFRVVCVSPHVVYETSSPEMPGGPRLVRRMPGRGKKRWRGPCPGRAAFTPLFVKGRVGVEAAGRISASPSLAGFTPG